MRQVTQNFWQTLCVYLFIVQKAVFFIVYGTKFHFQSMNYTLEGSLYVSIESFGYPMLGNRWNLLVFQMVLYGNFTNLMRPHLHMALSLSKLLVINIIRRDNTYGGHYYWKCAFLKQNLLHKLRNATMIEHCQTKCVDRSLKSRRIE